MQYFINSIKSTVDLAYQVAMNAKINDVLFLEGSVGSGKSTFVKHFLRYFEVEYVGSPTFGLINEYKVSDDLKIVHIDLYQSKSILKELQDYLDNSIILIEWPNAEVRSFFPKATNLHFDFDSKYRTCTIS